MGHQCVLLVFKRTMHPLVTPSKDHDFWSDAKKGGNSVGVSFVR